MRKLLPPPRKLDSLTAAPEEVASALHGLGLEGVVFLDTAVLPGAGAGSVPDAPALSIVAAQPARVVSGNLARPAELEELLKARARDPRVTGDFGFPLGGAIGWVDFGGEFAFGDYENLLVHSHHDNAWFEVGDGSLATRFLNSAPPPGPRPAGLGNPIPFRALTSRRDFCRAVERAREFIAAGDIYQVNLSHRFEAPWSGDAGDAFHLYERLRASSPAPYAAFLDLGGKTILSSSPESFLKMSGRGIRTRPIKGTRPRFRDPEADEKSAYDLITSPKEIAELIMITDLERNDLGRICEFGKVSAPELLKLERFQNVFHLVSTVEGMLRPEVSHLDALRSCFPGGSISGAPKLRALEIIGRLESTPRGLYTGAIGYFGNNSESQFNIAIRTLVIEHGRIHFEVGAGIVADSIPEREYEETLHKAAGIFHACGRGGSP